MLNEKKMSSSSRVGSFFTTYFGMRQTLLMDRRSERFSLYYSLVTAINTYLESLVWAKDEVDTNIYLLTKQGLAGKQIADALGIPLATYRTRIRRITSSLNQALFDGKTAYEIPNWSDEEITEQTCKVNCLTSAVSLEKASLFEVYSSVMKEVNSVEAAKNPDDKELFTALLFLASFSKQHLENLHKNVDLSVLKYVVDELNKPDGSLTSSYYTGVVRYISKLHLKQSLIDELKGNMKS